MYSSLLDLSEYKIEYISRCLRSKEFRYYFYIYFFAIFFSFRNSRSLQFLL